jgi:hypothetical protein
MSLQSFHQQSLRERVLGQGPSKLKVGQLYIVPVEGLVLVVEMPGLGGTIIKSRS